MPRKQRGNNQQNEQSSKHKFSANDRLKKLRTLISESNGTTKQEILKRLHGETVHTNVTQLKKENTKYSTTQVNNRLKQIKGMCGKAKDKLGTMSRTIFSIPKSRPKVDYELPKQKKVEGNLDDDMEWSDIEEDEDDELVSDLNRLRNDRGCQQSTSSTFAQIKTSDKPTQNISKEDISIVIDTNIFISHLHIISSLQNIKRKESRKIDIIIPWIVLQELDYLKDGKLRNHLQRKAQQAVKYINKSLMSKNSSLRGQSVNEALKVNLASSNPDDSILACCLQLKENSKSVILLSNDINLRNKVILHNVAAESTSTIQTFLKNLKFNVKSTRTFDVKQRMATLLSFILQKELEKAYGSVWNKLSLLKTLPPWDFKHCLQILEKYWQSVFSITLHKHTLKIINEFDEVQEKDSGLTDFCLMLLMHFKNGLVAYQTEINDCVSEIQRLGGSGDN